MLTDPTEKAQLLKEMTELVRRPELCFKDAEEAMFGRSSPIPTHSVSSEFEDDDIIDVSEDSNDNEDFNSILEAVYEKSGYVVMDNVVQAPKDDSWFADLVSDLRALYGTNNCVRIFNNRDDSHSHSKARVWKFFAPMFKSMELKLRALHLIQEPRRTSEPKLLISQPGCARQMLHYDFDAAVVSALRQRNQLIGVPISVLCSFTPGGSTLLIREAPDKPARSVAVKFGSMVIFTGDVVHAGSASKATNVRGFYHVVHEGLCPYDPDLIYTQIRKTPPAPAMASPATNSVTPVVDVTTPPSVDVATPPSSDKEKTAQTTGSGSTQVSEVKQKTL